MEVLPPSEKECRKKQWKTLVCVASDFYPDHVSVSWSVDGEPMTERVATDHVDTNHTVLRVGENYRITSRLRVQAGVWYTEGTTFTCTVSFFDGKNTTYHSDEIDGREGTVQHPE